MSRPILERPSRNFDTRCSATIDCVVIHDTGCREVGPSLSWFESPDFQISVHYVIDRDGTVYRCVAEQDRAWHAGESGIAGRPDVDTYSIGIELVGFTATTYMPAQIDALVDLCAALCARYRIPVERVVGHQDVAVPAGSKSDPGPHFPWADVRGRVAVGFALSVA